MRRLSLASELRDIFGGDRRIRKNEIISKRIKQQGKGEACSLVTSQDSDSLEGVFPRISVRTLFVLLSDRRTCSVLRGHKVAAESGTRKPDSNGDERFYFVLVATTDQIH